MKIWKIEERTQLCSTHSLRKLFYDGNDKNKTQNIKNKTQNGRNKAENDRNETQKTKMSSTGSANMLWDTCSMHNNYYLKYVD